jgi:hypothetical protein
METQGGTMEYPIILSDDELVAAGAIGRVDADKFALAIKDLRDSLQTHLASGGKGKLDLEELVVALSLTASGEVAFMTAKASMSATASVTATFKPN